MLASELRGDEFNKAAHNKALRARLDGRTRGAVERKHQNISAVLIELGFPYINGYSRADVDGHAGRRRRATRHGGPAALRRVAVEVQRPIEVFTARVIG